jgi:subtilisin family serine protease
LFGVFDAHKSSKLVPNDPDYNLQYGFPKINAPDAWDITVGNPNVIVAILDEGVQYNHPDLQANIWPGIGPDGTGLTIGDHGTHVGGTVGAVSNNGIGVAALQVVTEHPTQVSSL